MALSHILDTTPPSLFATAACSGLRTEPDCRPRRDLLHLSYSCAPSYSAGAREPRPTRTFFWPSGARSAPCSVRTTASCGSSDLRGPTMKTRPRYCSTKHRCAPSCGISACASLVNNIVLPHFYLFAPIVYLLEVLTAVSLILGIFVHVWALIGVLQIVNLRLGLPAGPGRGRGHIFSFPCRSP